MNGYELECAIRSNPCLQNLVKGVYARNSLPTDDMTQYPSAYIVNSDSADRPGEHWLGIVFKNKSEGMFFDSFGNPPEYYGEELNLFLNSNVRKYECFNVQVQSKNSSHCGLFVLTFLMLIVCLNYSLEDIACFFHSDDDVNDRIVLNFVNTYFSFC